MKFCLTIIKFGVLDDYKTFKCFTNLIDNLGRKEYFKMADGGNLIAKVPLSWNKSFSQCVVFPHKMEKCTNCTKDILCDERDKIVNQKKEISDILNEMKREHHNEIGLRLLKYITTISDNWS